MRKKYGNLTEATSKSKEELVIPNKNIYTYIYSIGTYKLCYIYKFDRKLNWLIEKRNQLGKGSK